MSLSKSVETIIKEAIERGEFNRLKGKGKPLDLNAYFETPEELRLAHSALKNAGYVSTEVELLQEIAALKEKLNETTDEDERSRLRKLIGDRQLKFNILMEGQRKFRNG